MIRAKEDTPIAWNLEELPPELEYFRTSEAYQVELSGFQGPMDLLLYLIQKEQIDIYDIPIARITDQFIKHIEVMQAISLNEAGEFLAMAATLLLIKTKMLMPTHTDEEIEEEDPRAELVRRLLEYKRFKEAAAALQQCEAQRRRQHLRSTSFPYAEQLDLEPRLRIGMYELLAALAGIFERVTVKPGHHIVREPFTVREKIALIRERLLVDSSVRFEKFFADDAIKMEVVVTFIAILELVKRGEARFVQTQVNGPIWLQPGEQGAEDDEMPDDETPTDIDATAAAPIDDTAVDDATADDVPAALEAEA